MIADSELKPLEQATLEAYASAAKLLGAINVLVLSSYHAGHLYELWEHLDSLEDDWEGFAELASELIERTS